MGEKNIWLLFDTAWIPITVLSGWSVRQVHRLMVVQISLLRVVCNMAVLNYVVLADQTHPENVRAELGEELRMTKELT